MRGDFAGIYFPFQCIEGCPQHESTQQRRAYGPLTLLPHKSRARHKKQAQVQNSRQNEFKRGRGGACESQKEGCPQHESTQPGPLTLLLAGPQSQGGRGGRLNLPTLSNTPPKGRRIFTHIYIHTYLFSRLSNTYMYIFIDYATCIHVYALGERASLASNCL